MKRNTISKTLLCLAIINVLMLAGCSSSNNDDTGGTDGSIEAGTAGDTDGGGTDGSSGNGTDGSTEGGTDGNAAGLPLDTLRDSLIEDLAGYSIEPLSEELLLIGASIAVGEGTELDPGSFTIARNTGDVVTATSRIQYSCALGGTMIEEIGRLDISESDYSNSAELDVYTFDQCLVNTDVEHSLDGTVRVLTNSVSASRASISIGEFQWSGLTWGQGLNRAIEGSALIKYNQLDSADDDEVRNVTIEQFTDTRSGTVEKRIENGAMALRLATGGSGFEQIFNFTTSGRVTTSAGIGVQINTDVAFDAVQTREESPDFEKAFTGVLSMVDDDGGRLTMTAQPVVRSGPKLVNVEYTSAAGETQTQFDVEFPQLAIKAP